MTKPQMYLSSKRAQFVLIFAIFSILVAIASLILAYTFRNNASALTIHITIVALWTIGPPIWLVFDNWGDPAAVGRFRHGQGLAGKLWAGILAALLAIYASGSWIEETSASKTASNQHFHPTQKDARVK